MSTKTSKTMAAEPKGEAASVFPEHEKLRAVADKSQAAGEFLDWLLEEKGYSLGQYHQHADACYDEDDKRVCGRSKDTLYPACPRVTDLLAEFFGIDKEKLEEEKRAMLAACRSRT